MTGGASLGQATRARERGAILRYPDLEPATLADLGQRDAVLLIHGITADARYLGELMRQFDGAAMRLSPSSTRVTTELIRQHEPCSGCYRSWTGTR
jgi:hypothetical protein